VPCYFFDSSALVKRYVSETGTSWISNLMDPTAENEIYLAGIAGVEVVSAIKRRERAGTTSSKEAKEALSRFRAEFGLFFIIEVNSALIWEAMALAEKHPLRGYDAVQLTAALEVARRRTAQELSPPELISADTALNDAALLEGLRIDDPNNH